MLSFVRLSFLLLGVITPSFVMLSVAMLSIVTPIMLGVLTSFMIACVRQDTTIILIKTSIIMTLLKTFISSTLHSCFFIY
jgi:hypothetical protein